MLAKKAVLTFFASVLDQAGRIIVNLVLSPIIIRLLGADGFGLWQVMLRVAGQVQVLDGRFGEVLKWQLARNQTSADSSAKRRILTASLFSACRFIPILILVSSAWIWFSASWLHESRAALGDIRVVAATLVLSGLLLSVVSCFEGVLRGANQDYRRMGVRAAIMILAGVCSALVVINGGGLTGLAWVHVLQSALMLFVFVQVVRKRIDWLGLEKPTAEERKQCSSHCNWFTSWSFVAQGLMFGDVIILGFLCTKELVSQYVICSYLLQFVAVIVFTLVYSALPGFAGIVGSRQEAKSRRLRFESVRYTWLVTTAGCATVAAVNRHFVTLWVGEELFWSNAANVLLIVATYQWIFIRSDADIQNVFLDIRSKVIFGATALALTAGISLLLVPAYGITGLGASLILGRAILSLAIPCSVNRRFGITTRPSLRSIRYVAVTVIALSGSAVIGNEISVTSWFSLLAVAGAYFGTLMVILFVCGFGLEERRALLGRLSSLGQTVFSQSA